ncbi:MAG: riboflavin biosynthesis protein RibF [Oscillospiraceae bacterium]|jgi:riboflavin kinase/FMN adenylyltransferase|nr:riboflavin biosynthesis protein RibF [Oscillospiraceae bacterium]
MDVYRSLSQIDPPIPGPSAVALGYFDGVHMGHQKVLCSTAAFASIMTPCVFTFSHLAKKGTTILSAGAKFDAFREIGFQVVVSLDFPEVRGLSPERFIHEILIEKMGARVVCCGNNFHFGKDAAGNLDFLIRECDKEGVSVLTAGQVTYSDELISSTAIRRAISEGKMDAARRMMGRPYSIDFEVIHGNELGRTLEFPTINQAFPAGFCVPAFGVYASVAQVDGQYLPAVSNVGVKPTIGSDGILAETNIIGCDKDLYGERVQVFLLEHLREETRFPSVERLKEQMIKDREQAVEISRKAIAQGDWYFHIFHGGSGEGLRSWTETGA